MLTAARATATTQHVSIRQHTLHSAYVRAYVSIRQHTLQSAYVSIRQYTSAYASIRCSQHTSAHVSTRQHTSAYSPYRLPGAYVSIRQHTLHSAYVSSAYVTILSVPSPWSDSIRQHTSAYAALSIRQLSIRHNTLRTSPYRLLGATATATTHHHTHIRQHRSAYVSVCQHTYRLLGATATATTHHHTHHCHLSAMRETAPPPPTTQEPVLGTMRRTQLLRCQYLYFCTTT